MPVGGTLSLSRRAWREGFAMLALLVIDAQIDDNEWRTAMSARIEALRTPDDRLPTRFPVSSSLPLELGRHLLRA
jgi:hypothetical protein